MTTIHARQVRFTKMHVMKTKKVLSIISNIFSHHIAQAFTPVLRFSPLYQPYMFFPLHPAFTPSLRCTSLHFSSLHFTSLHIFTLLDDFHFTSLHFTSLHFTSFHYTFQWFPAHFFLTTLNNRFLILFSRSLIYRGESLTLLQVAGSSLEWSYSQRNIPLYPSFASYS
jgi:hypothetical protein